jgi:S1-C subfamily serine protease
VLLAVLLAAWIGQYAGAVIGSRMREGISFRPAAFADALLGGIAGLVCVALVMWFVGGALRGGPSPVLSREVASSRVLAAIDRLAPDPLVRLADTFRSVVAGSAFPRVFAGVGPEDIRPIESPDPSVVSTTTVRRAARSIVKITGEATSCRRGQEGSGAVVAAERVVTNAHVVAGVRRPFVQVGGVGRRYPGVVVEFDPRRDLAVLAVPGLDAPALESGSPLRRGDSAVVAGFPRNGPFTAGAARVRSQLRAVGEDIYGRPGATRQVYSLYADVQPGNSGGPLLSVRGELVGVVFAKSLDDASTGYALTLAEARSTINEGIRSGRQVSSGSCAAA